MAEKRNVHVKVTSNVRGVTSRMKKDTNNALSGIESKGKGVFGRLGGIISKFRTGVIGAVVVALGTVALAFKRIVDGNKEFNSSLSKLQAISGASANDMEVLSSQARELGSQTKFTAAEVVALQVELSKLGASSFEINNTTESILDLARATGADLSEAARIAKSTMNAFGLEAEDMTRIVDVMTNAFSNSSLDINKFDASIFKVAGVARTFGVSIEETTALLGTLTDNGIEATIAGTSLRNIFQRLSTQFKTNAKDALQIAISKLDGTSSSSERTALAVELVGERAATSLVTIADMSSNVDDLTGKLNESAGAAKKMGDTFADNLEGDTLRLSSAFSELMLKIDGYLGLTESARAITQSLTDTIDSVSDAFKTAKFNLGEFVDNLSYRLTSAKDNLSIFAIQADLALSKIFSPDRVPEIEKNLADTTKKIEDATEAEIKRRETQQARLDAILNPEKKEIDDKGESKVLTPRDSGEDVSSNIEEDDEVKRLKAIEDFKKKLKRKIEDENAKDLLSKNQLARERHLEELENLKINETEKRQLVEDINKFYDQRANELTKLMSEDLLSRDMQDFENFKARKLEELQLSVDADQIKMDSANDVLNNSIRMAGEESDLAKGLFVIKQLLAVKDLISHAKNSAKKAAINAAESVGEVAKGSAKATATLNPFVIASYAASAVGVLASIATALSASKRATSGAGVSAPSVSTSSQSRPQAPSFNVIGSADTGSQLIASTINKRNDKPIRAYVVSGDVSDSQELDNKTRNSASF